MRDKGRVEGRGRDNSWVSRGMGVSNDYQMHPPRREGSNFHGMKLRGCHLKPTLALIIVMQILVFSTVSCTLALNRLECCRATFKSRHDVVRQIVDCG